MPADIVLYAVIAAGLIFWLRSVLGTRHGDERERPNPFTAQPEKIKNPAPGTAARPAASVSAPIAGMPSQPQEIDSGLERFMAIAPQARAGVTEIARAEGGFSAAQFLHGAQEAFIMIVEAFASGNRETLKNLLSAPLFGAFSGALDERSKKGETASVEIHAVRKAEIISAWIKDKTAFVTVRFVADETNVVRGPDNTVLSGDPERVTETIDIWTFGKPVHSRDPAWFLYETRDEDAADSKEKTVPDVK